MSTTANTTEGQKTYRAIRELERMAELLAQDSATSDHAFWLHVDREVIEECTRKLEKMGDSIERERCKQVTS